ncbi:MAG: alpha/beta hydrolase [Bacteroidota bacterium]|nr:alpha/beta hydrolase [Bacteroidota bacterium]
MLKKISNNNIKSDEYSVELGNAITIHTKILSNPGIEGKTAILLHSGAITGNHTLLERPARWLINKGVFREIIIPDRRGAGGSSPFTQVTSLDEQAEDIMLLLNKLGYKKKIIALGASLGGPISMLLASKDSRITEVILLASSFRMNLTRGKFHYLYKTGVMLFFIKLALSLFTGNSDMHYVNMDFVYDKHNTLGLIVAQIKILRQLNKKHLRSFYFMAESAFNKMNMDITDRVKLSIPITQIIGSKDKVWGKNISQEELKQYPGFRQEIIKGAHHRDLFLRADEFLEKIPF